MVDEPRDAGSTQICIDENDPIARQCSRSRKGERMGGLPLTGDRGGYTEGSASSLKSERSPLRALDGELEIGPGQTKCLGQDGPFIIQNHVRWGFPRSARRPRRRADPQ